MAPPLVLAWDPQVRHDRDMQTPGLQIHSGTRPHDPGLDNEDFVAIRDGVIVLLDGAGIPKQWPTGCIHSVHWFVQQLGPALLDAALVPGTSLKAALAEAIAATAALHADTCDLTHQNSPSATVVVARVGRSEVEGLVLCDSTLLVAAPRSSTEDDPDLVRAYTDPTLDELHARLRAQGKGAEISAMRNVEGGFWCAQDDPDEAEHALTFAWPRSEIGLVAALSDGATRIVDLFGDQGWMSVADQLQAGRLDDVLDRVRALEEADPDGAGWPRNKRHDDATIGVITGVSGGGR